MCVRGCGDATEIAENESLIGIPVEKLDEIVTLLKALAQKAMPEAQEKGVYNQLVQSQKK
jgi:uncharacterized protein (DUF169 family)